MLCPRCASNQSDEIKFCTFCGANLQAVRDAIESPVAGKKFDWSDTWVAEMFMSGQAHEQRKIEMERRMGITPETKRYQEIKAGVIVSSVGVALTIFLAIFMQGVAGHVEDKAADILTRLWIVGIIPFMVGLALIINGLVVSKRLVEMAERDREKHKRELEAGETPSPRGLRAPDTSEFIPPGFSVTDQTTRHLSEVEREKNPPRKVVK